MQILGGDFRPCSKIKIKPKIWKVSWNKYESADSRTKTKTLLLYGALFSVSIECVDTFRIGLVCT